MVLKNKRCFLIAFLLFTLSAGANLFAAKVPALRGRVNDYANVISSRDEQEMTEYLAAVEQSTGAQIVVLTVPSLNGDDIASYAIRVCEEWKIGRNGKDDGALLLLAMEERDIRIEVGYGLEDKLTDVKCGLILRNVIIPEFREGGYSSGLVKGVKNMCGIVTGNANIVSHRVLNEEESDEGGEAVVFLIFWIFIFFIILTSRSGLLKWILLNNLLGGRGRSRHYSRPPTFGPGPMNRGSSFTGSSFRGGGFGGGSSFHGGGGHFGGGGASAHF